MLVRRCFSKPVWVIVALVLALPALVVAQAEIDRARSLARSDDLVGASAELAIYLRSHRDDPQALLLQGVVLTDLGQLIEARVHFEQMLGECPTAAEALNNLAVLDAAAGRLDEARSKLLDGAAMPTVQQNALRTVQQNLLSLERHWAQLKVPGGRGRDEKASLVMIGQLGKSKPCGQQAALTDSPRATATSGVPTETGADVRAKQAAEARALTQAVSDAETSGKEEEAAISTIEEWRAAWSGRDVDAYLSLYSEDFTLKDPLTREEWEAQRREGLTKPKSIVIELGKIVFTREGDVATAKFTQDYRSDLLQDLGEKTLELALEDGEWKIREETWVKSP